MTINKGLSCVSKFYFKYGYKNKIKYCLSQAHFFLKCIHNSALARGFMEL